MSKRENKAHQHLASGALSGLASSVILQPLDLVKTRQQQGVQAGHGVVDNVKGKGRCVSVWKNLGKVDREFCSDKSYEYISSQSYLANSETGDTRRRMARTLAGNSTHSGQVSLCDSFRIETSYSTLVIGDLLEMCLESLPTFTSCLKSVSLSHSPPFSLKLHLRLPFYPLSPPTP